MERNGCLGVKKIERKRVFGMRKGVFEDKKSKRERPQKEEKEGVGVNKD